MLTKESVKKRIIQYVTQNNSRELWKTPLVGFADANHEDFQKLKEVVDPDHGMPQDVLPDAKIVISYFVPFSDDITEGNAGEGCASPDWAMAYEETNAMFARLNEYMISFLKDNGYSAAVSKEASVFDRDKIISRWSQRHIARIAGLGTFGLNNMLITKEGCSGRISSIVTDLVVEPDQPLTAENCLYKSKGICKVCIDRCPAGALKPERFDRKKCYNRCRENAKIYNQFGNSYASGEGEEADDSGSEVCGKCLTNLPCTFKKP